MRPISAKMSKHRRVLDDGFDPTIYEDLDEDADELSEQLSVSVTCEKPKGRLHDGTGGCGSCASSVRGSIESHSAPISRPTSRPTSAHHGGRAGSPHRVESRPSSATSDVGTCEMLDIGTLVPDDMVESIDDDDQPKDLEAEASEKGTLDSTLRVHDDMLLANSGLGSADCVCTATATTKYILSPRNQSLAQAEIPSIATGLDLPLEASSVEDQDLATFASCRLAKPDPTDELVAPRAPPSMERGVSSVVLLSGVPSVDSRLGRGPGASSPPPRKAGMLGSI